MLTLAHLKPIQSTKRIVCIEGNYVYSNANLTCVLVDNLTKSFDLLDFPQTSSSPSFTNPRGKVFLQGAIFLEDGTMLAYARDHGSFYTFPVGTTRRLSTTRERHVFASGTRDRMPNINGWRKQVGFYIYISETY
jgi:hypothetical protein